MTTPPNDGLVAVDDVSAVGEFASQNDSYGGCTNCGDGSSGRTCGGCRWRICDSCMAQNHDRCSVPLSKGECCCDDPL